jgi:hypothetical protein
MDHQLLPDGQSGRIRLGDRFGLCERTPGGLADLDPLDRDHGIVHQPDQLRQRRHEARSGPDRLEHQWHACVAGKEACAATLAVQGAVDPE